MTLSPGVRLGPYEIVAPLGAGGMGEVYRARDTRLGREVAVKVLPEHLSKNPYALARFEREARAVAALSHPNILAIHDFGSAGGVAFSVTELLEGETLGSRLSASALPWRKAIEIAASVADGLSAAHSKGIVHRDLKPENIFLTSDGRVKILDFGLARWTPARSTEAEGEAPTETEPGSVMGTVGYMSPEQVRGSAAEAPSDIFSLGCVLYEMVAGQRAFARSTSSETLAAILRDDPAPLSESGQQVPPELQGVVTHCLEKTPGERFQSARDLAFALRAISGTGQAAVPARTGRPSRRLAWISGALLLALIAAAVTAGLLLRPRTIESLAVLPFANASPDPNAEYLSDGITETLIISLSQLPDLAVKSRNSVFRYKGRDTDAQAAGQALKVQAVLTGRVAQRGDSLSISAELIDVKNSRQIWGAQYNRKLTDILAVQEEISGEISSQLRSRLTGEERKRVAKGYAKNTEAYRLFLLGRHYWNTKKTAEGYAQAAAALQKAIELDPGYATAYALLADIYRLQGPFIYGTGTLSAQESAAKSRAAASQALKLDETLADAHGALARIVTEYDWDWGTAAKEFRRALELDPNSAAVHHGYSHYLTYLGRVEESLRESRRTLELEPLDPSWNAHLGWHFMYARQYDQAIDQLRKTLEMEPNYFLPNWYIGLAYEQKSMWEQAIGHFQKALSLNPQVGSSMIELLAHAYAASGETDEARKTLVQLHELRKKKYVPAYGIAMIHTALGDKERAFQWLETAYRERDSWLVYLKIDPRVDGLRSDPRFHELLRRVGLG